MSDDIYRKVNIALWVLYILFPIPSGLLAYQVLADEYYDARRHVLLESHDERGEYGLTGEVCDKWRNKETGVIYARSMFVEHEEAECERLKPIKFAYGLIGCLLFAYWWNREKKGSFISPLVWAMVLDASLVFL